MPNVASNPGSAITPIAANARTSRAEKNGSVCLNTGENSFTTTERNMRNRDEAQLSRTFFEYLQAAKPAAIYTAVPNGGSRSLVEAVNMKRQGVIAGAADWVFTWDNGSGWIELKTETGKLSANQIAFQSACQRLGVRYEVARALEECIKILREWERL